MFALLRSLQPGAPLHAILFYAIVRLLCVLAGKVFFLVHSRGARNVPRHGPVLILANHESYLDPPLLGGMIWHRHLDYAARSGLFRSPLLGLVIRELNSIPVGEGTNDTASIREIVSRLQMGRATLLFPEGARTHDGEMGEFKRGFLLIVRKAKCSVVPAAIHGAYQAWPRSRRFPTPWKMRVRVVYGEPIAFETLSAMDSESAVALVRERVHALREALREASTAKKSPRHS